MLAHHFSHYYSRRCRRRVPVVVDLDEPTHTLVSCWTPKPLPPRNHNSPQLVWLVWSTFEPWPFMEPCYSYMLLTRATSHTRLRAHDHYTSSHSHWWIRRSRSKIASHYAWETNGVCECKMDVKSTWILYMPSNGSCFMVTWTNLKNHLLEASLTQNQQTMAL